MDTSTRSNNCKASTPSSTVSVHEEDEVEAPAETASTQQSCDGDQAEFGAPTEVTGIEADGTSVLLSEESNSISILLQRHRSSPRNRNDTVNSGGDHSHSLHFSRHRQELERILLDSAACTRHSLDLDDDHESDEPWMCCRRQQRTTTTTTSATPSNNDNSAKHNCSPRDILQNQGLLPCQQFLGVKLSWESLKKDVIAGTSVAIVAIPLSMSYAKLAGLPAYYGLYANLPACVYPLFGSSLQLSVGPAALVSLLLSTGISNIVEQEFGSATTPSESDEYVARYAQLAIQTSLLVGIVKIAMGTLKLGFVTQILSKALISGFTSGAAVMIAMSQVKHLFGVSHSVPPASRLHTAIHNLAQQAEDFSYQTVLMGVVAMIILVSLKYAKQKNPERALFKWLFAAGPLMVSTISILLCYTLHLEDHGIPLVGAIPPGLPKLTIDQWSPLSQQLWVMVASIVIVGYVQSFSIAKAIAYKRGYEIDSSQELIGLGVANIVGSMFQSFPVTGAMGQSAVSDDIGAQTGMAGVVTTVVVIIVLLFLTPIFEYMPLTVLAAIVISFVLGMFVSICIYYIYIYI